MNNKFTKQYIKECDCEEIQNIKQEGVIALDIGDWVYIKDNLNVFIDDITFIVETRMDTPSSFEYALNQRMNKSIGFWTRKYLIWLPTGDQLDEEIVKTCNVRRADYECYKNINGKWFIKIDPGIRLNEIGLTQTSDFNPYIAKIKLLKQLIKKLK